MKNLLNFIPVDNKHLGRGNLGERFITVKSSDLKEKKQPQFVVQSTLGPG